MPSYTAKRFRPNPTKISGWKIFFGLYLVLAVTGIAIGVSSLNSYLHESEASLPVHAMEKYVASLGRDYYSEMMRVPVHLMTISEYETEDTVMNVLMSKLPKKPKYTFSQDFEQSTAIAPTYRVACEGDDIALVTLRQNGETRYHQPVWEVSRVISIAQVTLQPAYSVSATVPNGSLLKINGVAVPVDRFSFEERDAVLEDAALAYTPVPTALLYEISGLYDVPSVQAFDLLGTEITPSHAPESGESQRVYVYSRILRPEAPPEIKSRLEALMRTTVEYMTHESTPEGTSAMDDFLVVGSSAYQLLHTTLSVDATRMALLPAGTSAAKAQYLHTEMLTNTYCISEVQLGTRRFRWYLVKTDAVWRAFHLDMTDSAS
ncbi:MAG: hypothetical protein IK130_09250 [Oscillospiraceae bacterium]|nr:hypothetical protein [Oscillospiraceae bacterium]